MPDDRPRPILIVAAAIGIAASLTVFLLSSFGAVDLQRSGVVRDPSLVILFLAPFAICMALGHIVQRLVGKRSAAVDDGA
ncbi:MAG: hypothetical protein WKG01_39965 [Kofleriaceae bacterium]